MVVNRSLAVFVVVVVGTIIFIWQPSESTEIVHHIGSLQHLCLIDESSHALIVIVLYATRGDERKGASRPFTPCSINDLHG